MRLLIIGCLGYPYLMDTDTASISSVPQQTHPEPSREDVAAYHRVKRTIHILDIFIALLYWVVWAYLGAGLVQWMSTITASPWLALLLSAGVMFGGMIVLTLPLEYYSGFVFHCIGAATLRKLFF